MTPSTSPVYKLELYEFVHVSRRPRIDVIIVLKQLAREYSNANPHKMRILLRDEFGTQRSWRWEHDSKELAKVHVLLAKHFKKGISQ